MACACSWSILLVLTYEMSSICPPSTPPHLPNTPPPVDEASSVAITRGRMSVSISIVEKKPHNVVQASPLWILLPKARYQACAKLRSTLQITFFGDAHDSGQPSLNQQDTLPEAPKPKLPCVPKVR